MVHIAGLALALALLWMLLSGLTLPLMLAFAAGSVVLVSAIAWRMDQVDGMPVRLALRTRRCLAYAGWLAKEVALSNVDVARRILAPEVDIEPHVVRVPASQQTDLGRVIYANSITLTPGTVTIDIDDATLVVHALSRAGADALAAGEMDRRVSALERPAGGAR